MNTNKIDLIKAEVVGLKSQLIKGACASQIAMETRCKEEAYNEVLAILDTMQEEPVSIWRDASKKSDNPEDVVIINPSDNTGEVLAKCTGVNQGHIWAYTSELLKLDNPCNIGKNLQEPQVKESAEIQHVNDMCKENGSSLTQEPVSEDLETFAKKESEVFAEREYKIDYIDRNALGKGYYWGCIDGAKWKKEQMMAKAKSGTVQKDNQVILDNGTYIDLDPSMQLKPSFVGLKEGDRIKVIIIKED